MLNSRTMLSAALAVAAASTLSAPMPSPQRSRRRSPSYGIVADPDGIVAQRERIELEALERAARNPFNAMVKSMTGRQRKKWARAGYPGLKRRDRSALEPFMQATE